MATEAPYDIKVRNLDQIEKQVRGNVLRASTDLNFADVVQHVMMRWHEPKSPTTVALCQEGDRSYLSLRSLTAGTVASGAELISGGKVTGQVENALAASLITGRLGVRVQTGWTSDTVIPTETTTFSGQWVTEDGTVTATDPAATGRKSTPHRVGCLVNASRQFLVQSPQLASQWLRRRIVDGLARSVDEALLVGTGTSGQPRGIYYHNDIPNIVAGTAMTSGIIADLENELFENNIQADSIRAVVSPAVRQKLRTASSNAQGSPHIIELTPNADFREALNGYPMLTSTLQQTDTLTLGDFSKVIVGIYGSGITLVTDPWVLKHQGVVQFYAEMMCDLVFTHPAAFVTCKDSTN